MPFSCSTAGSVPPGARIVPASPRRRGFSLVYVSIFLTVAFAIGSLAVDYGIVRLAKAELAAAADAAALAGSSGLSISPAEVRARAKSAAAENLVNGKPLVLLDSDIMLGTWDATARKFTLLTGSNESKANSVYVLARLHRSRGTAVKTFFLPLIQGQDGFDLKAGSIAGTQSSTSDIVVVQDVTGSFREELEDAKAGDRALLRALHDGGGSSKLGLVAFSGWGKTIADLKVISTNFTALDKAMKSLAIAGTTPKMPPSSGTDIASGLEEAVAVFDKDGGSTQRSRAIVLVSDGEPFRHWKGKHPALSNRQLLALARTWADTAWSKNIHVYVVFFDRDHSTTSANNLKTLIRGSGIFVHVTDPKKLPAALEGISRNLPGQLVQ